MDQGQNIRSSTKALAEVTEHFDNDLVVTSNLKDTRDIEPMLADVQSQRQAIPRQKSTT